MTTEARLGQVRTVSQAQRAIEWIKSCDQRLRDGASTPAQHANEVLLATGIRKPDWQERLGKITSLDSTSRQIVVFKESGLAGAA